MGGFRDLLQHLVQATIDEYGQPEHSLVRDPSQWPFLFRSRVCTVILRHLVQVVRFVRQ